MAAKPSNRIELHAVKYTAPPADLPVYGSVQPGGLTVMGRSTYVAALDEQRYVFGVLEEDRAAGVHVLGRAGSGKTKLLESMARQDLAAKRTFAVIDASGELVESLLALMTEETKNATTLIGEGYPNGIDLLPEAGKEFAFADTLSEAAAEHAGMNFDPKMRRVIATALESRPTSMAELAEILRTKPEVQTVSDMLDDILAFPTGRAILAGGKPASATVLAVLQPAELGFSRARALAHLVTDAVLRSRSTTAAGLLPLYVDGLELLGGRGGIELIRDMKRTRIAPVLAHRAFADASPALLSAISSTIGTEVAFRLSGEDATRARQEFSQTFDVRDFLVLGSRQCYVRLQIKGELREAFSAETLPLMETK